MPSPAGSWMVALYRLAAAEDGQNVDQLSVKVALHVALHYSDLDHFGAPRWNIGDLR